MQRVLSCLQRERYHSLSVLKMMLNGRRNYYSAAVEGKARELGAEWFPPKLPLSHVINWKISFAHCVAIKLI